MSKTTQAARKSTGGRAPRKSFPSSKPGFHAFKDHAGNPVTTVCSYGPKNYVSRLSLHLYTLTTLKETAQELCERFLQLNGITQCGNAHNYWPRVDVYRTPISSLEECMQHHRLEKDFRKRNGGLHIVPTWSRRASYSARKYRNVIFVIDKGCGDWPTVLQKGLLSVQYDLDTRPEDQFEILEAEDLDDPRDEGLVELNPVLDDPMVERVIIGREKEEEMRREQRGNWANGNYRAKYPLTLYEVCSDMTMALYDCTYRIPGCDGCEEGFEHTDCAIEQDRHYLDEEGQCVACSEFKGPWLDDDNKEDLDEEPAAEYAGALVIDRPRQPTNSAIECGVPSASENLTGAA